MGREGDSNWASVCDCGDRGYFQFERVDSISSLFPFPLVTAKLIGHVLSFFDHFTPSTPFAYSRCEHSHWQNQFISWIGKADQICRTNIQTNEILRIFFGGGGGFTWHHLRGTFCPTLPINQDFDSYFNCSKRRRKQGFYTKLHVQMANSHWSPQSRTNTQPPLASFWPT